MRDAPTPAIEKYRVRRGDMATSPGLRYGKFIAPSPRGGKLVIVATDGIGASDPYEWEHVSVTSYDMRWKRRMPTWEEMCWVKDQFWSQDEWAVQFHPAESDYVNNVSNCLHLWRPRQGAPQVRSRPLRSWATKSLERSNETPAAAGP